MSFRFLAGAATLGVVVVALFYLFLFPGLAPNAQASTHATVRTLLLALVAFTSAMAANRFGWWSEYVGRAWTLFFVEYALLTASEILRLRSSEMVFEVCVVLANLAGIGAYVLMARSLRAAGLELYGSPARKVLVTLLALILAIALCYSPIVGALEGARSNPGSLLSPLADVITFVLVAPLLLTAFALRGGQIFWMFAFLTTGTIGWMINQGMAAILRPLGGSEAVLRTGRMTGYSIACFFIAAAALTQWLTARRVLQGSSHG
jgi:hypothetical protein